ncbi:MAG: MG2 domain-containing protein, partial [Paludibacteraceae bacterium]|nr:MG2 domain-containing protein [Paludibacteraceae bacterium]
GIKERVTSLTEAVQVDKDSIFAHIDTLKVSAKKTADKVEKSAYYSVLAQIYSDYYNQNRYRIDGRTDIYGEAPSDMQEWTKQNFTDTIRGYIDLSLAEKEALVNAPTYKYKEIVKAGKDSVLCPTMYDILVRNAIKILDYDTAKVAELYGRIIEAHKYEPIVRDAAKFDLYAYRSYRMANGAVDGLSEQYKGTPLYVYVKAWELQNGTASAKEKHDACNQILQQYAESQYRGAIEKVKEDIERAEFSMQSQNGQNVFYPNSDVTLDISYKNLESVQLCFYKVNMSAYEYYNKRYGIKESNLKCLYSKTVDLPKTDDFESHKFQYTFKTPDYGIYVIKVFAKGENLQPVRTDFYVSKFLAVKRNVDSGFELYVTDRQTGEPKSNVSVKVYESGSLTPQTYKTDKFGIVSVEKGKKSNVVAVIEDGKDKYCPAVYNWMYSNNENVKPHTYTELFLDRGVYRPGQKVMAKGIVYTQNADTYTLNTNYNVSVDLYDANNTKIESKQVTTNAYGSFYVEFEIPEGLLNGNFHLKTNYGSQYFMVEEYKRPTFEVKTENVTATTINDSVKVKGIAKYFRGSGVAGAKVSYKVMSMPVYYYGFRCIMPSPKYLVASGSAVCNEKGEFDFEFLPNITPENNKPFYRLNVEINVTDVSGETQSGTYSFVTGETSFAISCNVGDMICRDSATTAVPKAFDMAGNSVDVVGGYLFKCGVKEYSGAFVSGKALDVNLSELESGKYTLKLTAKDDKGRDVEYKTDFILYSVKDKKPAVDTLQWVVPVVVECENGAEAEIITGSSKQNAYTLMEVYDQQTLIERTMLKLSNANTLVKVPYKPEFSDIVNVNFITVKNGKVETKQVQLKRKLKERNLKIELSHLKKAYEPKDKDVWGIRITDVDGNLKTSELLASVYDMSLDAISPLSWAFNPVHKTFKESPQWNWYQSDNMYCSIYFPYDSDSGYTIEYPELFFEGLPYMHRHYAGGATPMLKTMAVQNAAVMRDAVMSDAVMEEAEAVPDVEQDVDVRVDFAETALFYPQIEAKDGACEISFTAPDALTSWKVMLLAHNTDIQTAVLSDTIITKKTLSVNTNLPRFVRAADNAVFSASVENLSDKDLSAVAVWSVSDAFSGKVIAEANQTVTVGHGSQTAVQCNVVVPDEASVLKVRVTVKSENWSDGVEELLPVLSTKVKVTESTPMVLNSDNMTSTMALQALPYIKEPKYENAVDYALAYYINWLASEVVSNDANLRASIEKLKSGALKMESPLSADQNLKNILLRESPWVMESKMEEDRINSLTELLDTSKQSAQRSKLLRKLLKMQNSDGGFAWYENGRSSEYITRFVAEQLQKCNYKGRELDRALNYLSNEMESAYQDIKDKKSEIKPSAYDIEAMLLMGKRNTESYIHNYNSIKQFWGQCSLPVQAVIAQVLYADGDVDLAVKVVDNMRKFMVYKPTLGLYSPNTSTIETQSEYIKAFAKIKSNDEVLSKMKLWLLNNKQTNMWENSVITADAMGALMFAGKAIKVDDANAVDLSAVYRQYLADIDKVQKHTDSRLKIEKTYYIERDGVLHRFDLNDGVKVGDKITVRLVVSADREMEFVHIKDLRPAGFEPVNQVSRYCVQSGTSYYMTIKDCSVDFFFDRMNQGTYVFEYQLNATMQGNFAAGFASIESMYSADIKSQTEGGRVIINEK